MQKYKSRKEVPEKYKWDLSDFFKNEEDFDDNFKKCKKMVKAIADYRGCTENPKRLLEFLEKDIEVSNLMQNLGSYCYLINDQELGNSKSIEKLGSCENLSSQLILNESFFENELLELSNNHYKALFKKEKGLLKYKDMLDKIYRNKEHVLSEKEERIITRLLNAMNNFDEMSSTMLNMEHDYGTITINGEEEKIATTNKRRLMKNKDVKVRKEVFEKFNQVINRYGVSSAQFLNGYVKANLECAKIHNFDNAWEQKIFHLNMPNEAYKALVRVVERNTFILQKYYRLFKKTLNLKELHTYDLNMDMAASEKEYSIEEAQETILKAIEPLGEEYQKLFKKIFDGRYVDFAQYPGKCSGAYSLATETVNSRILMSFNYDLDSVSTLAHEGGHNVHHQLVSLNNPVIYRDVSNLVAEVASLTNECLLSHYLANNAENKKEKLAGINNILKVIISNLFGAVREGKMEQDFYEYVSEDGILTKDYMDELTRNSLKKYYGDEVILEDLDDCSWILRSHFYMNYYLYNYAFCISIASYVSSEILNGNKQMLDNYMKFLSTGSNVWPKDAFKILGVDLTGEKVYESAIQYFDSLLNEYEEILEGGE